MAVEKIMNGVFIATICIITTLGGALISKSSNLDGGTKAQKANGVP